MDNSTDELTLWPGPPAVLIAKEHMRAWKKSRLMMLLCVTVWYLQHVRPWEITSALTVIHHVNTQCFYAAWFTVHDSCLFQYMIQIRRLVSSKQTWKEMKRVVTEHSGTTCQQTHKAAARLKVCKLILQCSGALLFACYCWQSFCLILSMITVPCEPPYIHLWALVTKQLFPAHSGWENWRSLAQNTAQQAASGSRDGLGVWLCFDGAV